MNAMNGPGQQRAHPLHDPSMAPVLLLAALAMLVAVASVAAVSLYGFVQPAMAAPFAAFIAIGVFLRLRLPGDREGWPVATSGALAYALLPVYSGEPSIHHAYQVVTVTAVATLIGVIPHLAAGRAPAVDLVAREWLMVAVAACVFLPVWELEQVRQVPRWQVAVGMLGLASLALLTAAGMAALVRSSRLRSPFNRAFSDELRAGFVLNAAVAATAVMIALSAGVMGLWALVVFGIQMVLVQVAFKRYAGIRSTYRQTIRALSRVTEVGGYTETGHARRVCDISLAVGRELGMSESELLDLEYAALLHDIGQLSLATPIPGGATVVAAPLEQRQIAESGSTVITQTGVLDDVAEIVGLIADPYRRPHEGVEGSVPLASRIIRVVNAFDDLVGGSLESGRRFDALERLRLGMAYDYDPKVVETLSRIVERSTRFGL
jgi:hypothetical protein